MIRTASKSTLLAVAALFMGPAIVGCNKPTTESEPNRNNGAEGTARFELKVPGATVNSFHWAITQPPAPAIVKEGDHMVPQDGPSAAFLVSGLLPGTYTITLTATAASQNPDNTDPVTCSGTGMFMITPGVTSHATVLLACTQTPTKGSVAIDTTLQFEDCPELTSYLVSSTQPGPGGTVDVAAAATDRDPALALGFHWTATAGTFAAPGAATTTYTCPAGTSVQTITVHVTNGVSRNPAACPRATESILILCVPAHCGDGVVQASLGEACDNGVSATGARLNGPSTGCSYSCTSDTCGNGMIDPGEACDNGALNGSPTNRCTTACTVIARCGDGIVDAPEQCDGSPGCSPTCTMGTKVCGNGIVETFGPGIPEQCDDGGTANFDGCSSTCQNQPAVCGNGVRETHGMHGVPPEGCDDGNTLPNDGCSPTCVDTPPTCGNGIIETYPQMPLLTETCDDSNTMSLDGCSSTCKTESACQNCVEAKRTSGDCPSDMGCANLTGTERTLCQNLLTCMEVTHPSCWASGDPLVCLCGTSGDACSSTPNGDCRDEAFAAALTTSAADAGPRFYDTVYPSGHASQVIACEVLCRLDGVTCP